MPGWLQKLKNKSPKTRHRIALGTSVSVTCLIFVMWVTVLNYGMDNEVESLQASVADTQTASPLSAFSDNAASAFGKLKDGLSRGETTSSETDSEADSNSFWSDHSPSGSVSSEQNISTATSQSSQPFTSRNYNPSQEGEWFSQ